MLHGRGIFYGVTKRTLYGGIMNCNCRMWAANNPHSCVQETLLLPKVCGFTEFFNIGPYLCEENGTSGQMTCTVTYAKYTDMLQNFTIPQLQQ